MKIEKVIGNSIPEKYEYLRGGVFINVAPKEVIIVDNNTNESIVMYEYYQYFTMETNEVILEKKYISLMCEAYLEYLTETDHKFYGGYKPKEGEDLVEIERLRDEARDFIRANEQ